MRKCVMVIALCALFSSEVGASCVPKCRAVRCAQNCAIDPYAIAAGVGILIAVAAIILVTNSAHSH